MRKMSGQWTGGKGWSPNRDQKEECCPNGLWEMWEWGWT